MRHDDCGPGCDREFEDELARLHALARTEVELFGALAADVEATTRHSSAWQQRAAAITGRPYPGARAD
jgi:hypothetical protein